MPVYDGMAKYAEAAIRNPASDRDALWKQHVLDPYWERCAGGSELIDFAPPLRTAFPDVEALRNRAAALRAANIEAAVRAAVRKSTERLSSTLTTVCIVAADSSWTYLHDMGGVGGFTPGPGRFWITILPTDGWQAWITYTVAHEYHHSVWFSRHGAQQLIEDMTDYLVFEGRADAFATRIDPSRRAAWTHALTPGQESQAWATLQKHLRATDAQLLTGLMFGGAEGLPRWAGYTIGFNVVQKFLRSRSSLSVDAWTALDAAVLLQQSGYAPVP